MRHGPLRPKFVLADENARNELARPRRADDAEVEQAIPGHAQAHCATAQPLDQASCFLVLHVVPILLVSHRTKESQKIEADGNDGAAT